MIVSSFVTHRPQMGETFTAEEFDKFLGLKTAKLGVLAQLYPGFSVMSMTDAVWNIFYKNVPPQKAESLESRSFDWSVETNFIKFVEFAQAPEYVGIGEEICFYFKERYYEKYDIFRIEESRQQIIVTQRPVRRADNLWEVIGRIVDNDYSSILDVEACQPGMLTRWQSSPAPELSEEGYCKSTSNVEQHRNFMTFYRNDISWSSEFAVKQDSYFKCEDGDNTVVYKMDPLEKQLTDSFMLSKAQGSLFNKTNINPITGKCTTVDPDTGRPVPIGEGLVPQIERWANKISYNKLNKSVLAMAMSQLAEKSDELEGNEWMIVCNKKMWDDVQIFLHQWLGNASTDGAYLWSASKDGYIQVGATFNTYKFGGNLVTFKVDKAMTLEYGTQKGYGILIDLTADKAQGKPALATYTLKGQDYRVNTLAGVGGLDGMSSGPVATAVAGSKKIATGYAGVMVACPYKSVIIYQE